MTRLGTNSYGKARIRLVKVVRHGDRHDLKDLTVAVRLEGDFEEAHLAGDNRKVLPTDTMKNTVYALAAGVRIDQIEQFGIALAAHFLRQNPQVSRARIEIAERIWARLPVGDTMRFDSRECYRCSEHFPPSSGSDRCPRRFGSSSPGALRHAHACSMAGALRARPARHGGGHVGISAAGRVLWAGRVVERSSFLVAIVEKIVPPAPAPPFTLAPASLPG